MIIDEYKEINNKWKAIFEFLRIGEDLVLGSFYSSYSDAPNLVYFSTEHAKELFFIKYNELLKKQNSKPSILDVILSYSHENKISDLTTTINNLIKWLDEEIDIKLYHSEGEFKYKRKDIIDHLSNISKHSLFKLNGIHTKFKRNTKDHDFFDSLEDFNNVINDQIIHRSFLDMLCSYLGNMIIELRCHFGLFKEKLPIDAGIYKKYKKNWPKVPTITTNDFVQELYYKIITNSYNRIYLERLIEKTPNSKFFFNKNLLYSIETK